MHPVLKNILLITLLVVLPVAILVPEYVNGPVSFIAQLALGWTFYLGRVLPLVDINWGAVGTALFAGAAFVLLAHRFARRIHREITTTPSTWPLRWTVSAGAAVLVMFTAGLAATGVTQHTAGLATMDGPVFLPDHGPFSRYYHAQRVRCMSQLRQIGQALIQHASRHDGRFPVRLETVIDTEEVGGQVFVCPAADDEHVTYAAPSAEVAQRLREGHATYVYLTPNLKYPTPIPVPVVTEPLANHATTGLNILYSDGSVQWHTAADAERILGSPKEVTP